MDHEESKVQVKLEPGRATTSSAVRVPTAKTPPPLPPLPSASSRPPRECGCARDEGCHACGRCPERHCICGAREARAGICAESRACSCPLVDPRRRCPLCMGCRQSGRAYSHCRCVAHDGYRRRHQHASPKDELEDDDDGHDAPCLCFSKLLGKRRRRTAMTTMTTTTPTEIDGARAVARGLRLARAKRRLGIASSANLYQRKVQRLADGHRDARRGDEGIAGVLSPMTAVEEVESVLPSALRRRFFEVGDHEPGIQFPARMRTASSYLQSIEPTEGDEHTEDKTPTLRLTSAAVDRILENAQFTLAREETLPSDDLVDFLIFAASVKASQLPELVGTLDDTAAVAAGIVVEEYVRQVVEDAATGAKSLVRPTSSAVTGYARSLLRDFNWSSFLPHLGLGLSSAFSSEDQETILANLVPLIWKEFMATQDGISSTLSSDYDRALGIIREVVIEELRFIERQQASSASGSSSATPDNNSTDTPTETLSKHSMKITARRSKLTGQPVYRCEVARAVGGQHHATVAVDGLETRDRAQASAKRLCAALDAEHARLDLLENPPAPPEDPRISELFAQLREQVRQARSSQAAASQDQ